MRHTVVDEWSRRDSVLHRRDARVKLPALIILLIAIATTDEPWPGHAAYASMLLCAFVTARLPLAGALVRSLSVLPFAAVVALTAWAAGDAQRATLLLLRAYLSTTAVLLVIATTPLPQLLAAAETFGAPRVLVAVAQFVYRYLFVLAEQAARMRDAAASRVGVPVRPWTFGSATGALGTLFARSYGRAEVIHRAMLSRGYTGRMPVLHVRPLRAADHVFLLTTAAALLAVKLIAG